VRDLLNPFQEARLLATGGIHLDNAAAFLDAGAAALSVGRALVAAEDRAGLARRYLEVVRGTRQDMC
jgi:2-dehydro-3-deoxyphosphogluconate aldolase / (4S)-4-hydroxy-2-oxoglutarate aldolase